ncbi:MAG: hypothetical protein Kow00121_07330 [Elainellaceae cyanobacterium]
MLQLLRLFSTLYRSTSRVVRLGACLLLGAGISLLFLTNRVHAAETVLLQYRDLRLPVPLEDLQAFAADQHTSPELQQFLQETDQNPTEVRQWLTTNITYRSVTQLVSPEFLLIQINKTLGDPLGREDIEPLRASFRETLKDNNAFSVLEILEKYPRSSVRLEMSRLGHVYSDVSLLVTRIQPVLQIAKELLPELVCDCNIAPTTSGLNSTQAAIAYSQTRDAVKSLLPVAEITNSSTSSLSTQLALEPSDSPALANKNLVFQFGPFGRSISMSDLTRFAETGELASGWRFFLNVARVRPEDLRTALNQKVSVDLRFLDRTLNNLLGEFLLYEVGQVVHTQSNMANIQALRSAAILSVADDNSLSLLEFLQQYPTRQVYVDGARLARLGGRAQQFEASGGIEAAIIGVEDWLVQLQASAAEDVCDCENQVASAAAPPHLGMNAPTISPEKRAEFLPANWQPVAPHREDQGNIKVVWLQGTPYEMGYQHGQYLHDEIASIGEEVLGVLRFTGKGLALGRFAAKRSYPAIVEECQGLSDATKDIGMTLDACLVLAYGDVYQEIFSYTLPNVLFWDGCSQWVATDDATANGRLYHGSSVDNDNKPIDYIVNNPVVFVRQPNDGLPHVFITYPGVLWPNWGLNAAGITLGLDTAHPDSADELTLGGGSNVQIMAQILKTATSFAEAREIMETQPRVRANLIMIADGKSKQAGVFEFTGKSLEVRELQENGVLYMTNHFVLEEMYDKQPLPPGESSTSRFDRFAQLMEPAGPYSYYGQIDPTVMAQIGRDRVNPYTLQASSFDVFDDDASPGGNGSLRQGIYEPETLRLWVAGGPPPVPENPFVCFSLGEMLGFPNAVPCEAPAIE